MTIFATVFLFALPSSTQSTPGRQQQFDLHMKQAQVYLSENKPDQAVAEFGAIAPRERGGYC